jgi:hypothetical protein
VGKIELAGATGLQIADKEAFAKGKFTSAVICR